MHNPLRRLTRRLIRSERGQALVETALVMPVIVLLVFGILDAGRAFSAWIIITNAAREGARVGATRQPEAVITTRVNDASAGLSTAPTIVITNAEGASGTSIEVTVSTDVSMITPVIGAIFGNTVTLSDTAVMRLE